MHKCQPSLSLTYRQMSTVSLFDISTNVNRLSLWLMHKCQPSLSLTWCTNVNRLPLWHMHKCQSFLPFWRIQLPFISPALTLYSKSFIFPAVTYTAFFIFLVMTYSPFIYLSPYYIYATAFIHLSRSCKPRREAGVVWCLPFVWNLRNVIWFHFTISSLVLQPSPITLFVLSFFLPAGPFSWTFSRKFFHYFSLRDRPLCIAPV